MSFRFTGNLSDDVEVEKPREEQAPLTGCPVVLAAPDDVSDGVFVPCTVDCGIIVPRHGDDRNADGCKIESRQDKVSSYYSNTFQPSRYKSVNHVMCSP